MKKHAAPIVAAVFLLLPVLYVGSYLALVTPSGTAVGSIKIYDVPYPVIGHYRAGGDISGAIFWPLEQIDRKARPGAWWLPWETPTSSSGKHFSRREP
jgi:hypothetical protein